MSAKESSLDPATASKYAAAARPGPTGPAILALPQELFCEILNLIPARDWTSLRLACKNLAWRMPPFASVRLRGSSAEVSSRLQQLSAGHKRGQDSVSTCALVCARIK